MKLIETKQEIENALKDAYCTIQNYSIKHAGARNPYYIKNLTIEDNRYIKAVQLLQELEDAAAAYNNTIK